MRKPVHAAVHVVPEIKSVGPGRLNGPWTDPARLNMETVLTAVGGMVSSLEEHEEAVPTGP